MKRLLCVLCVLCGACGGSSPTAPSSPPPPVTPPAPITVTITGHVTATNGGQPLAGVSAALGSTNATTDGSGSFTSSMPPQASVSLALTGSSIVPRTIRVAATNTRDVTADAIMLGGGFDLGFYRQFVRDAYDNPGIPQPLRRWTAAPQILLKTIDESGAAINEPTLASTEQAIREALPAWTAGQFNASITRGTESRLGQPGWLSIIWSTDTPENKCGDATVGGGRVTFYPKNACKCGSNVVTMFPRGVKHELGHAMGFFHTDSAADVMYGKVLAQAPAGICDAQPSARERLHAAIAYSRPVGNTDPDSDSAGTVYLAPMRVP